MSHRPPAFREILLVLAATSVLTAPVIAQTTPARVPPDSLLAYSGIFRLGRGHDVAISPFRTPAGWGLLLSDVGTDQLRFLTSAGPDAFTSGAELTRPTPIEWRLQFGRAGSTITSLSVAPEGSSVSWTASRVPLDAVPVSFANGGIVLKGFVYRPKNPTRDLPLIALAHGSEESDRYSFGPIPLVLASRGFAVLAYDKRGTGLSSGDWKSVGLEEYADDLVAGIRASIAGGGIDTSRIAVLGLSEGGWVAPLASSRFPAIRAIAAISGGARTKGDAYVHKVRRAGEASGLSPAGVDSAARAAQQFVQAATERVRLKESPTGLDRRLAYDPTKDWRQFKGPVLYMGGEADVLESGPLAADWFRQISVEAGNADVTIRLWPRTHHSLILGVTGEPSEFQTFRGIKQLAPGYWDVLIGWLDRYVRALASTPTPRGG